MIVTIAHDHAPNELLKVLNVENENVNPPHEPMFDTELAPGTLVTYHVTNPQENPPHVHLYNAVDIETYWTGSPENQHPQPA